MSDPQIPSWSVLVSLMVHGPDVEPPVRGAIRSVDGSDESRGYSGFTRYEDDPDPIVAGAGTRTCEADGSSVLRVWRQGSLVRVEEPDGSPSLIVGRGLSWSFDRRHAEPLESTRADVRYAFRGLGLLWRREAQAFLGRDFTQPTGPIGSTSYLGRRAWTVELAPPSHKPYPMQLVVDAETGLLLQQRNDGFGSVDEWGEFVVGEEFDPALFQWSGPSRSEADEQSARWAEHEADRARRRAWVAENVTSRPLRLNVEVDLELHEWDETGAFFASLAGGPGSLARRRTSVEPWEPSGSRPDVHRWSDERWDWALSLHGFALAPGALAALKTQLGG